MEEQSIKDLHVELRNILGGPNPTPDAFIPRLHALELRRLCALEQTRVFASDSELSEEEQTFITEVDAKLTHPEQARIFQAVDISWRCLAVEQKIARKDAAAARFSLKHFDATDDALVYEAARRDRLARFKRREEKRTHLLEKEQPLDWLETDLVNLRLLSEAYVNLVASHVTAVEDHRIAEDQQPSQPSQDSAASLPTPQPSSPRADEVQSPLRVHSQPPMPASASQSPFQGCKRSADAMVVEEPAERRASSTVAQAHAMELDVYEEDKDELGAWINGEDSLVREEGSPSGVEAESAEAEVPSFAAAAPAKATAKARAPSPARDDDDVAATQPLQKLVPQPLLSKLGMAAKLNAEKLAAREETKRKAEKAEKAAAKRSSAQPSTSAAPPSRAVGPSNSTILMPPPPAASSTLLIAPPQPQPQPPVSTASQSSHATGSGDDSGEASMSQAQELPPAAQPAPPSDARTSPHPSSAPRAAPAQVLVPATQSSNESQEPTSQPFTQEVAPYYSTDESQDKQQSQPQEQSRDPTSSLEYVTDLETDGEDQLPAVSEKNEEQVGKSFGQLEGEATSGPDDEEAMTEVRLALAEHGSSSHSHDSLR